MDFSIKNDDEKLKPITLTKPAFCLNIGGISLYEMLRLFFGGKVSYKHPLSLRTCPSEGKGGMKISSRTVPSLKNMKKIKEGEKDLELIKFPHDVIIWNRKIMKENIDFISIKYCEREKDVYVGKDVKIHKSVVFDTSGGKIIIDDNSEINPFVFIKGPVFIGKNTIINEHASIKESVIGETCKVGGEVEDSIISDFSNKQHHGYLGNSYVGSWVNMGAGTSNSDLKNTYGNVKASGIVTDEQFLGCVICDFSKTAINTSIYAGKTIGVNSSISGVVSEDIPSFINYFKDIGKNEEFLLEKALQTQKRMLKRRFIEQKKEHKMLLEHAFESSKAERDKYLKNRK